MTAGEPKRPVSSLDVLVVTNDAARLSRVGAALRMARMDARLVLEIDEAETVLTEEHPLVLVLDQGLPRLATFRLYGLARADESDPPIQIVFVGQTGEAVAGDHYLASDTSPLALAARVRDLMIRPVRATPPAADAPREPAPPPPPMDPLEATQTRVDVQSAPAPPEPPAPVEIPPPPAAPSPLQATEEARPGIGEAAGPEPIQQPAPAIPVVRPRPGGRRLDVVLFRVGIVLLIIGGLLLFLRPDGVPQALTPPTLAPATPTQPPASPSPAAILPPAEGEVTALSGN